MPVSVEYTFPVEPTETVAFPVMVGTGAGFTVTVALTGFPVQLPAIGVMVKVTVTGASVVFVRAPEILPVPLSAIPVTDSVLSLVQLKTVPSTFPLSAIVVMVAGVQMLCEPGVTMASGSGLTAILKDLASPGQVIPGLIKLPFE